MTGPATVDMVTLSGNGARLHVARWPVRRDADAPVVVTLCGLKGSPPATVELDVDAHAVRLGGKDVCGNCRTRINDYNKPFNEEDDMAAAAKAKPDPKKKPAAKRGGAKKPAAKPSTGAKLPAAVAASGADPAARRAIVAEAERLAGEQPKRNVAAGLEGAAKDEVFRLGKQIAADKHRIVHAPASMPVATLQGTLDRMRQRIAMRAAILAERDGAKA